MIAFLHFVSLVVSYRHIIAAVHFNNNLYRDPKKNADGTEQIRIVYPKFKNGVATVRNAKIKPNFGKHLHYLCLLLCYKMYKLNCFIQLI